MDTELERELSSLTMIRRLGLATVLVVAACSDRGTDAAPATGAANAPLVIEAFGLLLDAPPTAKVIKGFTPHDVSIETPDTILVGVRSLRPGGIDHATPEAAKADALKVGSTDVTEIALPDGFGITYSTTSKQIGTMFQLSVRKEIGGTVYFCSASSARVEKLDAGLAICRTLRAR